MIRRFYILPLRPGAADGDVAAMIRAMAEAPRFIPGVAASNAARADGGGTVIWENGFVDEASYSGPYMVHPYHCGTLDDFLLDDSPRCITRGIFTARYATDAASPRLSRGIRRLTLLNLAGSPDGAAIAALARRGPDVADSRIHADTVGYVSPKGRAWTHVWEQDFTDRVALARFLAQCRTDAAGLATPGLDIAAMRTFTYPFAPPPSTPPPPAPDPDAGPLLYCLTARLDPADADAFGHALHVRYDRYVARGGGRLDRRTRSVAHGYAEVEIASAWALPSMGAYCALRLRTVTDPDWARFVAEAMPLVRGGSRMFTRPA